MGNHPSASRPIRRYAGSDAAPSHTGIGRCRGSGARLAPTTFSNVPSNVTERSVHRRRSRSICTSNLRPRSVKSLPSASYSTGFHPDGDSQPEPAFGQQVDFGGLFGHQRGLTLREDRMPVTNSMVVTAAR